MLVLEEILPATVACAEAFADSGGAELFPQEAEIVARAIDKRRREFATGRECARVALGKLGVPPAPILTGERGAPLWPPDIVGSITHCDGYRGAAVARAADVTTVGLDAEPNRPLPRGVLGVISLAGERDRLATLAAVERGVCWDRLLFCAKETVYKAWFPLTSRWLGFADADVTLDPDGTFTARLLPAGRPASSPASFAGRWLAGGGLVLAAIAVPALTAPRALAHRDLAGRRERQVSGEGVRGPLVYGTGAAGAPGADAGGGFAPGGGGGDLALAGRRHQPRRIRPAVPHGQLALADVVPGEPAQRRQVRRLADVGEPQVDPGAELVPGRVEGGPQPRRPRRRDVEGGAPGDHGDLAGRAGAVPGGGQRAEELQQPRDSALAEGIAVSGVVAEEVGRAQPAQLLLSLCRPQPPGVQRLHGDPRGAGHHPPRPHVGEAGSARDHPARPRGLGRHRGHRAGEHGLPADLAVDTAGRSAATRPREVVPAGGIAFL
jgi:4'-phosphopantetheinyl transferase EntD